MIEQTITCPNCRKKIPLSKALTGQIEQKLRKDLDAELKKREKETEINYDRKLTSEMKKLEKQANAALAKSYKERDSARNREEAAKHSYERKLATEKKHLKIEAEKAAAKELTTLRKQISVAQKREQETKANFDQKLAAEVSKHEKEAMKKAKEKTSAELIDLRKKMKDKDSLLKNARMQEQELKKLQKNLEAKEKALEIKYEQKLKKDQRRIESEITDKLTDEYESKDREDAKKLSEMRKQVVELKLKLEQSSQQRQGTVGEEELAEILKKSFPDDQIERVGKGKRGADILQRVHTQTGQYCGTIVWESKKAKVWSKSWLTKLRSDQRKAKAEVAVLVSKILPKEISHFAYIENVWVAEFPLVVGVAMALRSNLIQVMITKGLSKSKSLEIKELLYEYVTGTEFKHRVEAVIESFQTMQDDLKRERQAIEKSWASREKQIQVVFENIAGMYGDMKGMGAALKKIRTLELLPAS